MQALMLIVALLHAILAFFRSQEEQAIVELALRQQLATYAQTQSKPKLTPLDRAFWVALFRFWPRWKEALVIVKPDTIVRWHRKGFRLYWRAISKRGPGRPPISEEVRELIRRFALENGSGANNGASSRPINRIRSTTPGMRARPPHKGPIGRTREPGAGGPLQPPGVHEAPPVRRGRPPKRFTARLRAYKGLGDPAPRAPARIEGRSRHRPERPTKPPGSA